MSVPTRLRVPDFWLLTSDCADSLVYCAHEPRSLPGWAVARLFVWVEAFLACKESSGKRAGTTVGSN